MEHRFFNNSQILSPTGLRLKQIPCSISRSTAPSSEAVSRTPGATVKSVIVTGSLMFAALRQSRLDLSGNTGQNSLGFWVPAKIISVARICAARSIRVDDYDRH